MASNLKDMAIEEVKRDALRLAFEAQVCKLFGVLCAGLASEQLNEGKIEVIRKFNTGFGMAFQAYTAAVQVHVDAPKEA